MGEELDLAPFREWLDGGSGPFTEHDCRLLIAELEAVRRERDTLRNSLTDMTEQLADVVSYYHMTEHLYDETPWRVCDRPVCGSANAAIDDARLPPLVAGTQGRET